jgi:hypothetical protein
MHVQANYFDHAVQLGTSISIYQINLNELEPLNNKKSSFARFHVQKFKRTSMRVHAFSEKMTIVWNIYKR